MGWWQLLIAAGFLIIFSYFALPDLLLHRAGIGSWRRQYSPGIALTFDDGPHPQYTPQVLDLLARRKIPAAFFVVAERALKHPELIREIIAQGHQIGLHGQVHRHAWLMNPRATWRNWSEGTAALEGLSGQKIELIRPPWGAYNLTLWLWARKNGKRAVMWDVEGHDWQVSRTPEMIARRVLSNAYEGSIVVLHDSGGELGAPDNMLKALELICDAVTTEKKLPFVKLDFPPYSVLRRLVLTLWEKWERKFARMNNIQRIAPDSIMRVSRTKYHGPTLVNENGQVMAKNGDVVGEIHFDNIRLLGTEKDSQRIALQALRRAKSSLPGLAYFVTRNSEYADIKVFAGLSLITRGVKGFGFEVEDVPQTLQTHIIGVWQTLIMRIYHPAGKSHKTNRMSMEPKMVWITREELLERWLPKEKGAVSE